MSCQILVTTSIVGNYGSAATSVHTQVIELSSWNEALFACKQINSEENQKRLDMNKGSPVASHIKQIAIPLFQQTDS